MSLRTRLPSWLLGKSATTFHSTAQRRWISDFRPFACGDLVLLKTKQDRAAPPILICPLQPGGRVESHRGTIYHDDIIGRRVRDVVRSVTTRSTKAGTEYRILNVTLEDYVRLSKRLVTPIYGVDANVIVSLLDLHPEPVGVDGALADSSPKLEMLEAGTGHGSLTLHLSRAIHAANAEITGGNSTIGDDEGWRARRRAILHTVDTSAKFSAHAQEVVRGFRHGIYSRNVDFHVGDVSKVLSDLRSSRGSHPFLSHAILDMPSADAHLSSVAEALKTDGTLIVFNPSITQIVSCGTTVKNEKIPLELDKVIELEVNAGSGGREWDVRFVRPRASRSRDAQEMDAVDSTDAEAKDGEPKDGEDGKVGVKSYVPRFSDDRSWTLVCRPLVGARITGGGFLGVWKKQRDMREQPQPIE